MSRTKGSKSKNPSPLIGTKRSDIFKKKISDKLKGKMPKNIRQIAGWNKNKKMSKEFGERIRKRQLGTKQSDITKKKRSDKLKGRIITWGDKISRKLKGVKKSDKYKEICRKRQLGKTGEKANNWQGGLSFEPYSIDWTETLRRSIRERDHYICQLCNALQGDKAHSVHHIDYDKKNCNPNNLITLCCRCNSKVNGNRNIWIRVFNIGGGQGAGQPPVAQTQ